MNKIYTDVRDFKESVQLVSKIIVSGSGYSSRMIYARFNRKNFMKKNKYSPIRQKKLLTYSDSFRE